jgi:hypothetical protein
MIALLTSTTILALASSTTDAAPVTTTSPASVSTLRFGQKGQFVTSVGFGLSGYLAGSSASGSFDLSVDPSIDWFVAENLSVGLQVSASYSGSSQSDSGDYNSVNAGLGPRIGYNIRLSKQLSLWPRLFLFFNYNKYQYFSTSAPPYVANSVALTPELSIPLEFEVAPHVILGFGVYVETPVSHQLGSGVSSGWANSIQYGFSSSVGAYF